ncbi:putative CxxC motif protein [Halorubrum virus Serpecor1]|uniref:Putative CxxC motif protein n=1 Tax=Halorubrum virus Serpecor1 TaxID=2721757 RepID=A0A6G9RY43_9CAUD|nr:putative CxxC motif protein [Halorubrum virus Serpecor1]QIR31278.1 putative CxxC motif protein [Halorubrum virus Serpecor1]
MTWRDYPEDWMGNPDGRDYHYRFHANDEEAWKRVRKARWMGRWFELYPRDMKHLRVKLPHVTLKTYDHKGHIEGMAKYSCSPNWQVVPYSRGKWEMKHGSRGGSKLRCEEYTGEKWGTVTVEFTVEATPKEIREAYENGVNEAEIEDSIRNGLHWAVEERIDELREEEARYQNEVCDHDHVVKVKGRSFPFAYCEDCQKDWEDEMEFQEEYLNDELTLVGSV